MVGSGYETIALHFCGVTEDAHKNPSRVTRPTCQPETSRTQEGMLTTILRLSVRSFVNALQNYLFVIFCK
jgi:hypothetical protein